MQEHDREAAGIAAFLHMQSMQFIHRQAMGCERLDIRIEFVHSTGGTTSRFHAKIKINSSGANHETAWSTAVNPMYGHIFLKYMTSKELKSTPEEATHPASLSTTTGDR